MSPCTTQSRFGSNTFLSQKSCATAGFTKRSYRTEELMWTFDVDHVNLNSRNIPKPRRNVCLDNYRRRLKSIRQVRTLSKFRCWTSIALNNVRNCSTYQTKQITHFYYKCMFLSVGPSCDSYVLHPYCR